MASLAVMVVVVGTMAGVAHSDTVSTGVVAMFGSEADPFVIPNANVTLVCPTHNLTAVTDENGVFTIRATAGFGCCAGSMCPLKIWARQYLDKSVLLSPNKKSYVYLEPRPIPGFPAKNWRFEGFPINAHTSDIPGTKINFLAHPSAYRPPSGDRVFLTTTANSHAGPGWTQGYWQTNGNVTATAVPGQLINTTNPSMPGTAFTGRMITTDGRLLMLVGMGHAALLENKNLEDPSHFKDWVAAEGGDGTISVDFTGAPTTRHEDYRLHVFDQGFDCNGVNMQNWLFIIPDDVGLEEDELPADTTLNNTNLRQGNLKMVSSKSSTACSSLCDATTDCMGWVFEAGANRCFLKNNDFCVNPSSDPCGGCESGGVCPCTAGLKPNASKTPCSPSPPSPPSPHKQGRACGRMGFASDNLAGPYKYCHFVESPDPMGLDDPGGPASNCYAWPGDIIQSSDGSLYFVNGWGNIYKSEPGHLNFTRVSGLPTIARPSPWGPDDKFQIEYTFLPPASTGGRWTLYQASYSHFSLNPTGSGADFGYKQAIGMYTFDWE